MKTLKRALEMFYQLSPILCTVILLCILNIKFFIIYHYFPTIIGYDSPSHFAMIKTLAKDVFPSFWGWLPYWYAGMPMPLFYPPLAYYVSSFLISEGQYSALIFKLTLEFFILVNIVIMFYILKSIFVKEISDRKQHIESKYLTEPRILRTTRVYLPLILSIVIIYHLNTGAPNIYGIGLFSHQFSIIWFQLAVLFFWKRQVRHYIFGSICIALLLLSNIHAFLTLCIFLPFLIIFTASPSIPKKIVSTSVQSFSYFLLGISIASCWLLPMLYFYEYFTGIYLIKVDFSDRFFVNVWPIFIVLLLSTFISFKKNKKIFYFSLAVCTTNLVLFAIDITQRLDLSLILPVQLWRWYETLFVLMAIPLCYFLFLTMMRFRYVFVFTLLVLMLQSTTTHNEPLVYASYSQDNVPDLIKKIETTRSDGLILTQGNGGETYRQVVIDTELGAHGLHAIYTDIRESSINSIFLRIAKKMISTEEEGWALINFTQSMNSNRLEIDSLGPLLHFLGINQIINVQTNESDAPGSIVFSKSRLYATTFLPPTFSIASAIAPQSRVSQIEAPLTLIFAENGFRDRKISDPTYTRFQEIALEKKLYARSIAFSPHTPVIEENVEEINKAKYIVFATLETKNITKAIEVIENALIHPDRKIFILANKDYADEYQEFVQKFARHKQVVFVDVRNNIFPFDEVILSIIASEPFDYKEDPLSVEMSNTNISITKQGKYIPLQSQHLTQTIWFIRQSYFPAWKAIDTQGNDVPLYLASPGYTLAFPDKNTSISLYFTTPHIVIIGHLISLLGLITLLTIALYKYKTKKTVK